PVAAAGEAEASRDTRVQCQRRRRLPRRARPLPSKSKTAAESDTGPGFFLVSWGTQNPPGGQLTQPLMRVEDSTQPLVTSLPRRCSLPFSLPRTRKTKKGESPDSP